MQRGDERIWGRPWGWGFGGPFFRPWGFGNPFFHFSGEEKFGNRITNLSGFANSNKNFPGNAHFLSNLHSIIYLKCTIMIANTIMDVKIMKQIALSWSGGKDSCMALHKLNSENMKVVCLMTTVPQETSKTFAHNEDVKKIKAQADSLGIPIEFIHCTYDTYTDDFLKELNRLKIEYKLDAVAFGDMYLDGHKEWGQSLADAAELEAFYPLWSNKSEMLHALKRFVDTGYKAVVIKVREDLLPPNWVGRPLNDHFIKDISEKEVCPMGESGEYHTFVYDGPLFKKAISFH